MRPPGRTKWYNGESELVTAPNALELDRLLPSHYDMWKRVIADPTALHDYVRSFEYSCELELVEIGDDVSV